MTSGLYQQWSWLSSSELDLDQLLSMAPEDLIVGRYVAITSFDSGVYLPSPQQLGIGWSVVNHIAYSPRVKTCIEIPIAGWEEIYTFTARTILPQRTAVFVNYYDFALESEDDPLTKAFWEQLGRINPESCLLDGTISHLVSKRNDVVFRLWDQLKNRDT